MLTTDQINEGFKNFMHCSQQVVGEWAEKLGLERDVAVRRLVQRQSYLSRSFGPRFQQERRA